MAHEQNRQDDPFVAPIGLCNFEDPNPTVLPGLGSFITFGNTLFTDYDLKSMMNYCRDRYFGRTDLSHLDKLALRVYYGRIPSFDSRTLVLTIPRYNDDDGRAYTAKYKLGSDNKFRIIGNRSATDKPSKSPPTMRADKLMSLNEVSFINNAGHVNQILNATLTLANPAIPEVYNYTFFKVQPTLKEPTED